jgi:CHAD domain-containing protein
MRVKKARAILQLIDDDHGRGLGGSRRRLRSVGRALSTVRDADATVETLERLRTRYPRLFTEATFEGLRRRLSAERRGAVSRLKHDGTWKRVERILQRLRARARDWRPAHHEDGALVRAVKAAHRRGRRAMKRAVRRQRAKDFHAWRKEIKMLWYTLRLVELSDADLRRDVRALKRAQTLLGDDHNLGMLCRQLSRDATLSRRPGALDRLRVVINRDQSRLRDEATARIGYVYERRSDDYARMIQRVWKGYRKH